MSNTIREILFRGKILKIEPMSVSTSDEWVYGFYVKTICTYIYSTLYWPKMVNVAPETVGQFTGLTDKNGNKIFEGDIVVTTKFNTPNKKYVIKYNEHLAAFIGVDLLNDLYFTTFDGDADMFEIIGNIHDNELLEESNA